MHKSSAETSRRRRRPAALGRRHTLEWQETLGTSGASSWRKRLRRRSDVSPALVMENGPVHALHSDRYWTGRRARTVYRETNGRQPQRSDICFVPISRDTYYAQHHQTIHLGVRTQDVAAAGNSIDATPEGAWDSAVTSIQKHHRYIEQTDGDRSLMYLREPHSIAVRTCVTVPQQLSRDLNRVQPPTPTAMCSRDERHEWRSRLPKPELGRGAGDGNGDVKGGGDASGEARALCRNRDRPKEFSAKTGYNLHRIEGCDHDRRPSLGGRHHNLSNCDFDKEDSRGGGRSANLNKNNSVSEFPQTMRFSADNMDSVGRTCELPSPSPACDSKASGTSSKSYFSRVDRRNCASRPPPFSVIGDRDKLYNSNGSDEKSEGDCDGDKHLPDSRCSVKRDQYELATASVQPRTSRRGGGVACRRGYTIDDSTHTPATVLGSAVPESSGMKFDLDIPSACHGERPRLFADDTVTERREAERQEERVQKLKEALALTEELARREVEAAQASAAAERTARAVAEASMSDARASLKETAARLQETLDNGPAAALVALMEEKKVAEAMAAAAVDAAAAAAEDRDKTRNDLQKRAVLVERASAERCGAEAKQRGKELLLAKEELTKAQHDLIVEQKESGNRTREFRAALKKARREASMCRAKASNAEQQLHEADVSGLQSKLVSLASDKAIAQSQAAAMQAKLAHASSEHRRLIRCSRVEFAAADERLSAAELRASAAESRVNAIASLLTTSERRLKELGKEAIAARALVFRKTEGPAVIFGSDHVAITTRKQETDAHRRAVSRGEGVSNMSEEVRSEEAFVANPIAPPSAAMSSAPLSKGSSWSCRGEGEGSQRFGDGCSQVHNNSTAFRNGDRDSRCPHRGPVLSAEAERNAAAPEERGTSTTCDGLVRCHRHVFHDREDLGSVRQHHLSCNGGACTTSNTRPPRLHRFSNDEMHNNHGENDRRNSKYDTDRSRTTCTLPQSNEAGENVGTMNVYVDSERRRQPVKSAGYEASTLRDTTVQRKVDTASAEGDATRERERVVRHLDEGADTAALLSARKANEHAASLMRDSAEAHACLEARLTLAREVAHEAETVGDCLRADSESRRRISEDNAARGVLPPAAVVSKVSGKADVVSRKIDPIYRNDNGHNSAEDRGTPTAVTMADATQSAAGIPVLRGRYSDGTAREDVQKNGETLRKAASRSEVLKRLNKDLNRARTLATAATEGRRAAEDRIGELETVILESERHQAQLRERGELRLEVLEQTLMQEHEEGGAQAALSVLLQDKTQAEAQTVELQRHLAEAHHEASVARRDVARVKKILGTQQGVTETSERAHCDRQREAESAAALAVAEADRLVAATKAALCDTMDAAQEAQEQSERLEVRLAEAQIAHGTEEEEKRSAQSRVVELERAMEAAMLEQEVSRERAEARLATLERAFEQEARESGGQAALECLLHEKATAEQQVCLLEEKLRDEGTMMGTVGTQPVRGEIPAFVGDRVVAAAAVAVNVGDSAAAEIGRNGIELKRAPKKSLNNAAGDVASTHTMIAAASHAKGTLSPPMTSVAKPAHQQSPIARGTRMELAGELASARVAQVVAEAATRKEKAISKRKMTELESMIEATQREHERQRGTVESRLEMLQMALDQDEEENGKHAPFAALLQEKQQAERHAAEVLRDAEEGRVQMERELEITKAAARKAENKAGVLKAELDTQAAEALVARAAAESATVAAVDHERAVTQRYLDAREENLAVVAREKDDVLLQLNEAELVARASEIEAETLRAKLAFELEEARVRTGRVEQAAEQERSKSAEEFRKLEGIVRRTNGEHERHKDMVNCRLESIRTAFEQEEEEKGAQVVLAVLLEDKAQAEQRARDASRDAEEKCFRLKQTLHETKETLRIAKCEAQALKAELKAHHAAANPNSASVDPAELEERVRFVPAERVASPSETNTVRFPHTPTVAATSGDRQEISARRKSTHAIRARENCDRACQTFGDDPQSKRRQLKLHKAHEAVRTAEATIATVKAELNSTRADATNRVKAAIAKARDSGEAAVTEARRIAAEESFFIKRAASAATERAATTEVTLQRTESTLARAKQEVNRLTLELERAQVDRATVRAETQKDRDVAAYKIAELEGVIKNAESEHKRSQEKATLNLEELAETLAIAEKMSLAKHERMVENAEASSATTVSLAAEVARTKAMAETQEQVLSRTEQELRVAQAAVLERTNEVEKLKIEVALAREAEAASMARIQAAEGRIVELESELQRAEREHTLFQDGVERRLANLRNSFEEEERESGAQAALTAILKEKFDAESRMEALVQRKERSRSDLEHRLKATANTLQAVEETLSVLELDRDLPEANDIEPYTASMAKAAAPPLAAAPTAECDDNNEMRNIVVDDKDRPAPNSENVAKRGLSSPLLSSGDVGSDSDHRWQEFSNAHEQAAIQLRDAARAESNSLRLELDKARSAEAAAISTATEDKEALERRVLDLERAIKKADSEHEHTRRRTEARLDEVGLALEQEEQERGGQMALTALLEEKSVAEVRAEKAEQDLAEVFADARAAEGKISFLEADLALARNALAVEKSARMILDSGSTTNEENAEQVAEKISKMEASLRKAKLKSTRMGGQIEHLRNELDVARDQERSAAEAADKEREASRRKIVELESAATTANREHTLFKERTEERLERLRIAVEDEERENGSQEALAVLLQQNIQAEVIATDLARSTAESRGRLENQLRAANESLLQAEKNEAGLRLALGSAQRDAAASIAAEQSTAITRAMAEGIVDVVVAAAIAAGEEREHSRAIIEGIVSSADERVDSAQRRAAVRVSESSVEKAAAERILQGSTLSALHVENASREKIGDARLDANRFQHEAGRAREAEERAKDETHVARDKIAALEAKIEKSERMHALFRERAELRLETLRSAVEEEDVEHGTQAALKCLLQERSQAQAQVVELEARLQEARQAILAGQAEVIAVKAELNGTEDHLCSRPSNQAESPALTSDTAMVVKIETSAAKVTKGELGVLPTAHDLGSSPVESSSQIADERGRNEQVNQERHLFSDCGVADLNLVSAVALSSFDVDEAAPSAAVGEPEAISSFAGGSKEIGYHDYIENDESGVPVFVDHREDGVGSPSHALGGCVASVAADKYLYGGPRAMVEARLEGLRFAVEQQEEEAGVQAALAALLDEKHQTECRAAELERQLEQSQEAVRVSEIRGGGVRAEATKHAGNRVQDVTPSTSGGDDSATQPADKAAAEMGRVAAVGRAGVAESALSDAVKVVKEVEARCASAQARDPEARQQALARERDLARELEEANNNGLKPALTALLEESSSVAIAVAPKAGIHASTAAIVGAPTDEAPLGSSRDKALPPSADVKSIIGGDDVVRAMSNVHRIIGKEALEEESDGGRSNDNDGRGGGAIVRLLAERDGLLRERERLEQEAKDMSEVRRQEAYRRVVGVGRYELTLDIATEDLNAVRKKLAQAEEALFQGEGNKQLQSNFRHLCKTARHAEDAKKRADEQLAETQEQLVIACKEFERAKNSNWDGKAGPSVEGTAVASVALMKGAAAVPLQSAQLTPATAPTTYPISSQDGVTSPASTSAAMRASQVASTLSLESSGSFYAYATEGEEPHPQPEDFLLDNSAGAGVTGAALSAKDPISVTVGEGSATDGRDFDGEGGGIDLDENSPVFPFKCRQGLAPQTGESDLGVEVDPSDGVRHVSVADGDTGGSVIRCCGVADRDISPPLPCSNGTQEGNDSISAQPTVDEENPTSLVVGIAKHDYEKSRQFLALDKQFEHTHDAAEIQEAAKGERIDARSPVHTQHMTDPLHSTRIRAGSLRQRHSEEGADESAGKVKTAYDTVAPRDHDDGGKSASLTIGGNPCQQGNAFDGGGVGTDGKDEERKHGEVTSTPAAKLRAPNQAGIAQSSLSDVSIESSSSPASISSRRRVSFEKPAATFSADADSPTPDGTCSAPENIGEDNVYTTPSKLCELDDEADILGHVVAASGSGDTKVDNFIAIQQLSSSAQQTYKAVVDEGSAETFLERTGMDFVPPAGGTQEVERVLLLPVEPIGPGVVLTTMAAGVAGRVPDPTLTTESLLAASNCSGDRSGGCSSSSSSTSSSSRRGRSAQLVQPSASEVSGSACFRQEKDMASVEKAEDGDKLAKEESQVSPPTIFGISTIAADDSDSSKAIEGGIDDPQRAAIVATGHAQHVSTPFAGTTDATEMAVGRGLNTLSLGNSSISATAIEGGLSSKDNGGRGKKMKAKGMDDGSATPEDSSNNPLLTRSISESRLPDKGRLDQRGRGPRGFLERMGSSGASFGLKSPTKTAAATATAASAKDLSKKSNETITVGISTSFKSRLRPFRARREKRLSTNRTEDVERSSLGAKPVAPAEGLPPPTSTSDAARTSEGSRKNELGRMEGRESSRNIVSSGTSPISTEDEAASQKESWRGPKNKALFGLSQLSSMRSLKEKRSQGADVSLPSTVGKGIAPRARRNETSVAQDDAEIAGTRPSSECVATTEPCQKGIEDTVTTCGGERNRGRARGRIGTSFGALRWARSASSSPEARDGGKEVVKREGNTAVERNQSESPMVTISNEERSIHRPHRPRSLLTEAKQTAKIIVDVGDITTARPRSGSSSSPEARGGAKSMSGRQADRREERSIIREGTSSVAAKFSKKGVSLTHHEYHRDVEDNVEGSGESHRGVTAERHGHRRGRSSGFLPAFRTGRSISSGRNKAREHGRSESPPSRA